MVDFFAGSQAPAPAKTSRSAQGVDVAAQQSKAKAELASQDKREFRRGVQPPAPPAAPKPVVDTRLAGGGGGLSVPAQSKTARPEVTSKGTPQRMAVNQPVGMADLGAQYNGQARALMGGLKPGMNEVAGGGIYATQGDATTGPIFSNVPAMATPAGLENIRATGKLGGSPFGTLAATQAEGQIAAYRAFMGGDQADPGMPAQAVPQAPGAKVQPGGVSAIGYEPTRPGVKPAMRFAPPVGAQSPVAAGRAAAAPRSNLIGISRGVLPDRAADYIGIPRQTPQAPPDPRMLALQQRGIEFAATLDGQNQARWLTAVQNEHTMTKEQQEALRTKKQDLIKRVGALGQQEGGGIGAAAPDGLSKSGLALAEGAALQLLSAGVPDDRIPDMVYGPASRIPPRSALLASVMKNMGVTTETPEVTKAVATLETALATQFDKDIQALLTKLQQRQPGG